MITTLSLSLDIFGVQYIAYKKWTKAVQVGDDDHSDELLKKLN